MATANTNPDNALIFGGDDDAVWLGEYTPDLLTKVKGLTSTLPTSFVNAGWIGEDGMNLPLDDSTTEIRGHQGHGIVKSFMDSSKTSFAATLLESRLKTYAWYMDAVATKISEQIGGQATDVTKLVMPSSRKVRVLSAVVDTFSVDGTNVHERYVFPRVELGARGELVLKSTDITAYSWTLTVIGHWEKFTTAKGMLPAD